MSKHIPSLMLVLPNILDILKYFWEYFWQYFLFYFGCYNLCHSSFNDRVNTFNNPSQCNYSFARLSPPLTWLTEAKALVKYANPISEKGASHEGPVLFFPWGALCTKLPLCVKSTGTERQMSQGEARLMGDVGIETATTWFGAFWLFLTYSWPIQQNQQWSHTTMHFVNRTLSPVIDS